jgi:hypothetical protein
MTTLFTLSIILISLIISVVVIIMLTNNRVYLGCGVKDKCYML